MKKTKKLIALSVIVFMLCSVISAAGVNISAVNAAAAQSVYYVSAVGNDSTGNGIKTKPYKTIEKVRDVIRSATAKGMTKNITVYIRGGEYYFQSPAVFDEKDSGKNGFTITYKNYPGEKPILTGGKKITGWQKYSGNIYKAKVTAGIDFKMLFENGEAVTPARFPNDKYITVTKKSPDFPRTVFGFKNGDVPQISGKNDLEIYCWSGGPHKQWNSDSIKVKSIDYTSSMITLGSGTAYEMDPGSRFYLRGALQFIDSPGEFYLDKAEGYLYYYPRKAPIEKQVIVAPYGGGIISLQASSNKVQVQNLIFSGLEMGYTAISKDIIAILNAKNNEIKNCKIIGSGGAGVVLKGNAQDNKISGNLIKDMAVDGVDLIGKTTKFNTITNNHIYNVGLLNGGDGSCLYIGSADSNTVSYNTMHDSPRMGISIYGNSLSAKKDTLENLYKIQMLADGKNNIIEYNDTYRCVSDSQDGANIYAYGTGTGNIVRNNNVHDSSAPISFDVGIYLDDGSDGFTIYNNIVHNMQSTDAGGYLKTPFFAKGVDNKLYNNVSAKNTPKDGILNSFRMGQPNWAIQFNNNISHSYSGVIFGCNNWTDDRIAKQDNNVFYNTTNQYGLYVTNTFGGTFANNFDLWKTIYKGKFDQNSRTEDPLFMSLTDNDFRIKYNSPGYAVGFKDINYQDMGLKADFPFANKNEALKNIYIRTEGSKVNNSFINLTAGKTTKLELKGRTTSGYVADLKSASITYSSDKAYVATVNSSGEITAKAAGVAKITATVKKGNVTKSTDLHVIVNDAFDKVKIHVPLKEIPVNSNLKFSIDGISKYGQYMAIPAGSAVSYTSSNKNVISTGSGKAIKAVAAGKATLSVTVKLKDGTQLKDSIELTVK